LKQETETFLGKYIVYIIVIYIGFKDADYCLFIHSYIDGVDFLY